MHSCILRFLVRSIVVERCNYPFVMIMSPEVRQLMPSALFGNPASLFASCFALLVVALVMVESVAFTVNMFTQTNVFRNGPKYKDQLRTHRLCCLARTVSTSPADQLLSNNRLLESSAVSASTLQLWQDCRPPAPRDSSCTSELLQLQLQQ